ncbi:Sec-independent protein translocase subunit TatA/TatB, partial [Segatella copri]|uniref:Sec-independent protein translocase subunit TatA/TatB n=1 Tax=Segatella copri TaxID=165179 RepID=UPI00345F469E
IFLSTSIISTTLIISIMLLISVLPLMIGSSELFVIAAIVLLLFGAKKIPELMKSMGQGVRYFKKGMNEDLPDKDLTNNKENEVQLPKDDK